jgi:hypothetical protein
MPITLNGSTSGQVTIDAPAVAGTTTITLPAQTGIIPVPSSEGTSGQVLTSAGTGSAPTWETPSAGSTIDYFDCYDTSTTNVNSGAVVPFSVTRQNSDGAIFALSSGVVTISETGVYLFQFQITTQITSGTGRSSSYAWLEEDTGGGFSAVAGSYQYMYNRTLGLGENTGSSSLILSVTSGYDYRVYCTRYAGSDTVETEPNASRLTIMKIA